jgi:hypothetical protein
VSDETGANTPAKRWQNPATRFKPGVSGNPAGRPKKVVDVAALARDGSDKAMAKLIKLIDSESESIALAAANSVLDRAIGKPKQSIEKTTKKEAADYDAAELLALARMGSTRAAETPSGETEPHRVQ